MHLLRMGKATMIAAVQNPKTASVLLVLALMLVGGVVAGLV
jgi:hypothetical protein